MRIKRALGSQVINQDERCHQSPAQGSQPRDGVGVKAVVALRLAAVGVLGVENEGVERFLRLGRGCIHAKTRSLAKAKLSSRASLLEQGF